MAGPLSGLGAQTQVQQYSQTQTGQSSNQVRPQDERQQPQQNKVQPKQAPAADTQQVDTNVNAESLSRDKLQQLASEGNGRGNLLDIVV
ncbi:MAG: hypothetical protein KTR28_03705 [Micavibrio sp.]|nr:hypothetical protein [Micavibrio sp.]